MIPTTRLFNLHRKLNQWLKNYVLSVSPDLEKLETDELGSALIPYDTDENYRVIKVPGVGNCLYNCVSIFLSGDDN